ncbi:MAG TPA: RDD family protein [Candidatus Paceibacterota bacterium]|nr:RDD family protein [Candidatus Paceibacterota bacterium]
MFLEYTTLNVGVSPLLVALFMYHFIFEALLQKTIGKMITGTKVVSIGGEKPSLSALARRSFARYIPFESVSFLFYGNYPTVGWHDRFSGTLVVPDNFTPEQIWSIYRGGVGKQKLRYFVSLISMIVLVGIFYVVVLGMYVLIYVTFIPYDENKCEDARLKSTLENVSAQAQLYYDDYNFNHNDRNIFGSYEGFCTDSETKKYLSDKVYACYDNVSHYALTSPLEKKVTCA